MNHPRIARAARRAGPCVPRHDASPHARIHPTAAIEDGVHIGAGTAVWDHVHVRGPASIGSDCIIGEKTYIAYGVSIGNYVKINARVYVCTGITIEDRVLVAAGVVFTNERHPRAFADGIMGLAPSEPTVATLSSTIRTGATIGAGTVLGPGIDVGPYAMVGMGSVLTASVPAHGLVYGNPARLVGYVCTCGAPLHGSRGRSAFAERQDALACTSCGRRFTFSGWKDPSQRALVETES
jgi:acetyltransferase-like isoleucine patch superfamily enzyme